MKTVCVAGSRSRAGKTTFAAKILARLAGWSACKVTTCVERAGQPCPRGAAGCGVCSRLTGDFEIEEETGGPATARKDTGRLRAAGARKVLWVRARPHALGAAIEAALEALAGSEGVVFEGNHVLEWLDPEVSVMVLSPDGSMKKSAREVRDRIDFFARGADDEEALERVVRSITRR